MTDFAVHFFLRLDLGVVSFLYFSPYSKEDHKKFVAENPEEAKLLDQITKFQEDRTKQVWGKYYKSHKEDMKRIGKKLADKRKTRRKKLFK